MCYFKEACGCAVPGFQRHRHTVSWGNAIRVHGAHAGLWIAADVLWLLRCCSGSDDTG